jgi:hypothetical protein
MTPAPPAAPRTPALGLGARTESSRRSWSVPPLARAAVAWLALGAVLAVGVPIFLCMPLCVDGDYFGNYARSLQRGDALYRNLFFMQPPGFVLAHLATRTLLGWRSEAIRLADLLVLAAVVGLAVSYLKGRGVGVAGRVWTAAAVFAFYFSTSEWCHCQPDLWMLLPALAAWWLRNRQLDLLRQPSSPFRRIAVRATVEGVLWGMALLIKPHVLAPAIACYATATLLYSSGSGRSWSWHRWACDAGFLLLGGLLVGGACAAWLTRTGSLPYLLETARGWGAEYYAVHSVPMPQRLRALFAEFLPWSLVHIIALPLAIVLVVRARAGNEPAEPLFAAFYLAWTVQAVFWQWALPYHLTGGVLLGLVLVAGWLPLRTSTPSSALLGACVVSLLVLGHPLTRRERLAWWGRCWQEGSSARVRDGLRRMGPANATEWEDLERVAEFLRHRGVGDREVTCYHNTTIPLYLRLDVRPSTRFLWIDQMVHFWASHEPEVRAELARSPQRFVVTDLGKGNPFAPVPPSVAGRPHELPPGFRKDWARLYPWCEPVVFRSGRYVVHQATGPVTRLTGVETGR